LLWDPTKAKTKLGWNHKYSISEMVSEMVKSDIELFRKEQILKKHGYEILAQYE
jgi:GDPmannose 4,6-dehydratase